MYLIYDSKTNKLLSNILFDSKKIASRYTKIHTEKNSFTRCMAEGRYPFNSKYQISKYKTLLNSWMRAEVVEVEVIRKD